MDDRQKASVLTQEAQEDLIQELLSTQRSSSTRRAYERDLNYFFRFVTGSDSRYDNRKITKLTLVMQDNSERIAYVHSHGYFEGYLYNIFQSKKAAFTDAYEYARLIAANNW